MPARRTSAVPPTTAPESPGPVVVDGIRVGVGGWTYAPWRDNFYPTG
jgi:hypothetical protein